MRLHLITVGEPKLAYAKAGWQEYHQRLKRYHKLQVSHITAKDQMGQSKAILKAARKAPLILLDPRGKQWTSEGLSTFLDQQAVSGIGELAFAIGGPDGHTEELRGQAKQLWGLGLLTFPHDLAMVVMLEALYRAATISAGEPYHRG